MKIRWYQFLNVYLLAIAVLVAGNLQRESVAATQKNPSDDIRSTALPGQIAPRLQNLGNHKFPVTTNSARAQLFINQALMLTHGFNHAEAMRSFREAARLDPNCAMAYWGMALVLGPNINMAMSPEAEPKAYDFIQKAIALKDNASEKERAYIDALAVRYSGAENSDRSALDRAYAAAMLEDNLIYNEPPDWHVPVRQSLGAVLLEADRPAEAEAIYWQDLEINRENTWSLFGLMQSLRAQGKDEQAKMIEERFKKAWKAADVTLTASRMAGDPNRAMAAAGTAGN